MEGVKFINLEKWKGSHILELETNGENQPKIW